jgi:2-oxoglutarate/2-oxoacid ferredoxin oxidoreductase subunit alpha
MDEDLHQTRTRSADHVVIRFAGDSGDGIQAAGTQFSLETALAGNSLATFPDFPAEIRAPVGTLAGVSSFQVQFSSELVRTPGDQLDVLVAFNPAALKANLIEVKKGGYVITDAGGFNARALKKAGYEVSPFEDGTLEGYQHFDIDISKLVTELVNALPDVSTSSRKTALRARNLWALGAVLWMFDRDRQATRDWIGKKFAKNPETVAINQAALDAGYKFGATVLLPQGLEPISVAPARQETGTYRSITGTDAIALGLVAGALDHGLSPVYCSYPITPASNMLHALTRLGAKAGVRTFQAEDEIAAICAALGASYAGQLGITGTSGPGMALKTEALGLAAAAELPLVIINTQRGGPSTGLPTKAEQSDLYQAVLGRNGDTMLPVLSASSPSSAYEMAQEAIRIAVKYMTPVILLSDGYVANASEPWKIPELPVAPRYPVEHTLPDNFAPFRRDPQTLSRPWVVPGVAGGVHRLGGLERKDVTGEVSYDPANHQRMTDLRRSKILGIATDIPEQQIASGESSGGLAVVGWGLTYGPISDALTGLRAKGVYASHIHLSHMWPFPRNLGKLLKGFRHVLVAEQNTGQLVTLLRAEYLIDARSLNKVTGQPFKVAEIEDAVCRALLEEVQT